MPVLEAPAKGLSVLLDGTEVGTLAQTPEGLVAFQYSVDWLQEGFSINPYSLPLEDRVFVPQWQPFSGLLGAFHDSLPDGWGALLLDRMLAKQGLDPVGVSPVLRLAIVGSNGRGALCYEPEVEFPREALHVNLDELAQQCARIFNEEGSGSGADQEVNLDAVYAAGGSSGGARPKTYYTDESGSWLVKFPSHLDPPDSGKMEFAYMACAKECGIQVPEFKLFPSKLCSGYFASARFDRIGSTHVHMLSASGILEVSHRIPSLDYRSLFQLSYFLTHSREEAMELFRRMSFNVFAHNYDDHSNNFSWLCKEGQWELSPAYDLTYSSTAFGGHSTTVLGNDNPGMDDVLALASEAGIPSSTAKRVAGQIKELCDDLIATI